VPSTLRSLVGSRSGDWAVRCCSSGLPSGPRGVQLAGGTAFDGGGLDEQLGETNSVEWRRRLGDLSRAQTMWRSQLRQGVTTILFGYYPAGGEAEMSYVDVKEAPEEFLKRVP
jgi:hypothetical protein